MTAPDRAKGETRHRLPNCLPDGRGVLFTISKHNFDMQPRIALLPPRSKDWRVLLENAAHARYAPTGHLIFAREGILMAVPFDLEKLEVSGQPVPVIADVMQSLNTLNSLDHTGAAQFSFSDTGCLVYAKGGITPDPMNSLVWVDHSGAVQEVVPFRLPFYGPRLSPDGGQIVYQTVGSQTDIWLYNLERQATPIRLTADGGMENSFGPPMGSKSPLHR